MFSRWSNLDYMNLEKVTQITHYVTEVEVRDVVLNVSPVKCRGGGCVAIHSTLHVICVKDNAYKLAETKTSEFDLPNDGFEPARVV